MFVDNGKVKPSFIKQYAQFKKPEPHYFPERLKDPGEYFINEMEFMAFIILNPRIQTMLGWDRINYCDGQFPDMLVRVPNGARNLRVEIEYHASNYNAHQHPYLGCDVVISWIKHPKNQRVRGCHVWSFYTWDEAEGCYVFSLNDDISATNTKLYEPEPDD